MNGKLIVHYISRVLKLLGVLMLFPLVVSLLYRDMDGAQSFLISAAIVLAISIPMGLVKHDQTKLYAKEGFLIVAISWIALSVLGALPFWISREVPSFVDCLFESVSGFTTTGASILREVESLSKGLLFWRSFTHWIGGMGVLVFLMAVIPAVAGDRALYLMKAEAPGPAPGKLVPRMRQSSKLLYIIYLVMTAVMVILLCLGGMPLFDSVVTSMSTAGTGGFAATNDSIATYGSLYCEVVITIFMILFGINFNIFYLLVVRSVKGALKNEEMWVYLGIVGASIVLITWNLTGTIYATAGQSLRYASFQVGSFITTTGFSSINFLNWPTLSKIVLFTLMFIGGCAGSTAGGLKVSRIIIMVKEARRTVSQIIRPRSVKMITLDGKSVEKETVRLTCNYGVTCAIIFFISLLIISFENMDMETTMVSVATCLNNVGQGFGLIGPGGGFADFSPVSKLVFCLNMLLGRLELYPILLLMSPRTWKKV